MRIGIDVRYLSHGLLGGVHTYVEHFVPEVIALATEHQIFLYADTKRPFELRDLPGNVTVRFLPWRNPLSSIVNDLFMRRQLAQDRLDVVHFPANYGFGPAGTRTVITLHDALNILPFPQIYRGLANGQAKKTPRLIAMTAYLHYCTTTALRRADLIVTVSEHAKREIAHHGSVDPDRIIPIPHAPTSDLRRIEETSVLDEVRNRHGISRPFVLADALKNPGVLVQAWRLLPPGLRQNREIVFFSRRPDPLPIVGEAVAAGEARLLVRPSREDLVALYSMAEAFVFPSWIEGFGIPVLEAMTCGAPVIASNRGAIPEVVGDAALLGDADDVRAFAYNIERVLTASDLAEQLRARGFLRARRFSWRDTAQRTLACYERTMLRRHSVAATSRR